MYNTPGCANGVGGLWDRADEQREKYHLAHFPPFFISIWAEHARLSAPIPTVTHTSNPGRGIVKSPMHNEGGYFSPHK